MLAELADSDVFVWICVGLDAGDLVRIEQLSHAFWAPRRQLADGSAATWSDCAAEQALIQRTNGWRVTVRHDESWKYALFVLERMLAPLPVVATGGRTTLVAGRDGLWAWGEDLYRQLGLADRAEWEEFGDRGEWDEARDSVQAPPGDSKWPPDQRAPQLVKVLANEQVVAVAARANHSAAITAGGRLWTWGGQDERLGHGGDGVLTAPKVIMGTSWLPARATVRVALVATGDCHTAVVTSLGELFTCGDNISGELGLSERDAGSPGDDPTEPFYDSVEFLTRVGALGEMRVIALACGSVKTAAVTATGGLFMWGGSHVGDVGDQWLPERVAFPSGARIRRISSCGDHHAAVADDGTLFEWGCREDLELPFMSAPQRVDLGGAAAEAASCGGAHTAVVTRAGELWTWGLNSSGQLGHGGPAGTCDAVPRRVGVLPGGGTARVAAVSCGLNHTAVVLASGVVCSFGHNGRGQLGLASEGEQVLAPVVVPGVRCTALAKHDRSSASRSPATSTATPCSCGGVTRSGGKYKRCCRRMAAPSAPSPPRERAAEGDIMCSCCSAPMGYGYRCIACSEPTCLDCIGSARQTFMACSECDEAACNDCLASGQHFLTMCSCCSDFICLECLSPRADREYKCRPMMSCAQCHSAVCNECVTSGKTAMIACSVCADVICQPCKAGPLRLCNSRSCDSRFACQSCCPSGACPSCEGPMEGV